MKAKAQTSTLFEAIAGEAIIGILAFDAHSGRGYYINRLAREILELDLDTTKINDLKVADLVPVAARPGATPFTVDMLMTETLRQNILVQKSNGQIIFANTGVRHLQGADGQPLHVLMFQDVTIQRKLQRDLETKQEEIKTALNQVMEQNKQLLELDHAKDKFIALTTHELRTPLSAIVATAEVLVLKLYESDEQKEEFIKTIHEQGLHLMTLVNDILDFAKIRAGKMELYVEQMDLAPLIAGLTGGYDNMAQQSGITIDMEKTAEPMQGYVDPLRLREVINNVVSNAIKYNRKDGTVKVRFSLPDENLVRVTISDTGIGIPAEKLHHVFNEFETVESMSSHHKGTGLGMPISKRLMQAMGGDLTLSSVAGEGTSFYIDVPRQKVLAEDVYRSREDESFDLVA